MEEKAKVFVAGATGFIGRRLVPALLERGFPVRCLSRRMTRALPEGTEILKGDLLQAQTLDGVLADVDTAYYLVHSMGEKGRFAEKERISAQNFAAAAQQAGVRRVIYLSGLGEGEETLSAHLSSRSKVADILQAAPFKTTTLRSGVILGEGGTSYEIIRFLVRTSIVLPTKDWLHARCQPLAVDDAIHYLVGCLENEQTAGRTFDIGGPEIMTYYDLMETFADEMKIPHLNAPVPFFMPKVLAGWIAMMTPVNAGVARALLEGVHLDVLCRDDSIRELLPFELTPCREAIRKALAERAARLKAGQSW